MTINTTYASASTYQTPISLTTSKTETSQRASQATLNPHSTPQNTATTSFMSEFGFRINEQGIFDKDFNKAASIPESYEINIKSVQSIAKALETRPLQEGQNSQSDIPQLINRYFSTLRSVEGEFASNDNAPLSRGEIMGLNQGFSTQSGEFDGMIKRIYASPSQLARARADNKELSPLGLDNEIIDFGFKSTITNTADNDFIKPYLNRNGEVSKSGLLMNFIYEDISGTGKSAARLIYEDISGEAGANLLFLDAINLSFANHQRFYEMLDDEGALKSFINEQISGGMSFDLFLRTHYGDINRQSISDEKLIALYQQYKNTAKNANIEQFARNNSIFQNYAQILFAQFNSIRSDYGAQSSPEVIGAANELRSLSFERFNATRQRQISREAIIKTYKSVMGEAG